jgi:hypothetical protein
LGKYPFRKSRNILLGRGEGEIAMRFDWMTWVVAPLLGLISSAYIRKHALEERRSDGPITLFSTSEDDK